jgi:hypothetical protein
MLSGVRGRPGFLLLAFCTGPFSQRKKVLGVTTLIKWLTAEPI